jgi:hypothetical protein
MADTMTHEESFEYSLHNLLQWLHIMTLQPGELCNAWGNYNVAWELVTDLRNDGRLTISSPASYLTEDQKQKVSAFLESLGTIPQSLQVSATSITENQKAMSHPCWVPFRESAARLLKLLEPAAKRNRVFFNTQHP